jgi:hypothetical protein
MRKGFSEKVKKSLALRVAYRCSYPGCNAITVGADIQNEHDFIVVGEAAHIYAASDNGPRGNTLMSIKDRSSISNGIWMCRKHARLIDEDIITHSADTLKEWKKKAEIDSHNMLRHGVQEDDVTLKVSIVKNASILLELENIKEIYRGATWADKGKILKQLNKYLDHVNEQTAYEILRFLSHAIDEIVRGMPSSIAFTIFHLVENYFYTPDEISNEYDFKRGHLCINIGFDMAYGSAIKLRRLTIMQYGLLLWKYIYKCAKDSGNNQLIETLFSFYNDLESTLQRPERNDLENALQLVRIFRNDLNTSDMGFPLYPLPLMEIIDAEHD